MSDNNANIIQNALSRLRAGAQAVITGASADKPMIVGGRIDSSALAGFLETWRKAWTQTPLCITETTRRIDFESGFPQQTPDRIQRLDLFDGTGHLTLRKDMGIWYWHYIGTLSPHKPAFLTEADTWADYWTSPQGQDARFYCYPEEILLWGEEIKHRPGTWWDDRVAAATLQYPNMVGKERVQLHFWRYTQNGETAFIWYRELKELQGKSDHAK